MIYLDNAATTRIKPEVLEAMMPYLTDNFGNAGGLYRLGRESAEAIEQARKQVASLFGCDPKHVIFTSGGTESNNMVFAGTRIWREHAGRPRLACSSIEHDSVYRNVMTRDTSPYVLRPSARGIISVPNTALPEEVGLLSVMYVNNETGVTNPVKDLSRWAHASGALFHTDCVQATGLHDLNVKMLGDPDFVSISAHKIHGPKGMGALYIKDPDKFIPMIKGGYYQEYGLRGGTENVAGIVGFGAACQLLMENRYAYSNTVSRNTDRFISALTIWMRNKGLRRIMTINGSNSTYPSRVINVRFEGVDAETLLLLLDDKGICASAGSACHSHSSTQSRTLLEMGLSETNARNSVRFSFDDTLTEADLGEAAKQVADAVEVLHKMYLKNLQKQKS